MNRAEFISAVAEKAGVTNKDTVKVLEAAFEIIQNTVAKGDEVKITNFGTFCSRKRAARAGRNPQTGEEIQVPASCVPAFRPGKGFKERVRSKN